MSWLANYQPLDGVRLNMVVGANGELTDETGSSRGLSNQTDRELIGYLRSISDIYVTGGNTARSENYRTPSNGTFAVITRDSIGLPGNLFITPPIGEPVTASALKQLRFEGFTRILLEVGPSLASQFLVDDLVDELCLTIPSGDVEVGEKLLSAFGSTLTLTKTFSEAGTLFTIWRRGNDS